MTDKLARIEAEANLMGVGLASEIDSEDVLALVNIAKAAREVEDTLRRHARGVDLIGARHKLYDALAVLDGDQ